jgi:hypothetical protein
MGGRFNPAKPKQRKQMSAHVATYYTHLMNSVDTGCPMRDYCTKDIYIHDILRNLM